ENQRLNAILAKIIRPAFVMCRYAFTQLVDYLEIELGGDARFRFLPAFWGPHTGLACNGPGNRLLDLVPAAHPDVFRLVENNCEKLRSIQILVFGNFLQQLEHSFEIIPQYDVAEDSIGCRLLT